MLQIKNNNDATERLTKLKSAQRILVEHMNDCGRSGQMGKRKEAMLKIFDMDAEELIYKKYLKIVEPKCNISAPGIMPVDCGMFTEADIKKYFKLSQHSFIEYQ